MRWAAPRTARRARGWRSIRSRCGSSAAPSTRSPRRWRACCSGCRTRSIIRESEDLGAGLFDAAGPRALRIGLHADAHRLAAVVHPRLPRSPRGRHRGRGRDRAQPPVPGRVPHAPTSRSRCRSSTTASCSASRRSPRTCSTSADRSPGSTRTRSTSTRRPSCTTRCAGTGGASSTIDIDRMIFDNVRTETMNRGDMNAMMAACQLGRDRFLRLLERYGVETVMSAAYELDGLLGGDAARADREDPGRRVRRPDRLARRRRAQPRACGCGSRRRWSSRATASRST